MAAVLGSNSAWENRFGANCVIPACSENRNGQFQGPRRPGYVEPAGRGCGSVDVLYVPVRWGKMPGPGGHSWRTGEAVSSVRGERRRHGVSGAEGGYPRRNANVAVLPHYRDHKSNAGPRMSLTGPPAPVPCLLALDVGFEFVGVGRNPVVGGGRGDGGAARAGWRDVGPARRPARARARIGNEGVAGRAAGPGRPRGERRGTVGASGPQRARVEVVGTARRPMVRCSSSRALWQSGHHVASDNGLEAVDRAGRAGAGTVGGGTSEVRVATGGGRP